jgi:hypothetical protein
MDAGPKRWRVLEGLNHVDLVVHLQDPHAHAVVAAVLLLTHARIILGVVEAGVWIEHAQHARNCPIVDGCVGLVAFNRLGVILFHERIDRGE